MNQQEAIEFSKMVMVCFDHKEFRSNWERLRKKPLRGEKAMRLFVDDVRDLVWERLPHGEEGKG